MNVHIVTEILLGGTAICYMILTILWMRHADRWHKMSDGWQDLYFRMKKLYAETKEDHDAAR